MYRIDATRVRACFDVPLGVVGRLRRGDPRRSGKPTPRCSHRRSPAPSEKRSMPSAFSGRPAGFRPRAHYGRGKVALAGDAVGYFHPMTCSRHELGPRRRGVRRRVAGRRDVPPSARCEELGSRAARLRALSRADATRPQWHRGPPSGLPDVACVRGRAAPDDAHPRLLGRHAPSSSSARSRRSCGTWCGRTCFADGARCRAC
jgi:hypothetical protein